MLEFSTQRNDQDHWLPQAFGYLESPQWRREQRYNRHFSLPQAHVAARANIQLFSPALAWCFPLNLAFWRSATSHAQNVWSCEDLVVVWNCSRIWRNHLSDFWKGQTGRAAREQCWRSPNARPTTERQGWFPAWRCNPFKGSKSQTDFHCFHWLALVFFKNNNQPISKPHYAHSISGCKLFIRFLRNSDHLL